LNLQFLKICNLKADGCKLSDIPDTDDVEDSEENKHNAKKIKSYCAKTLIEGYCKPEQSYAEFECFEGYELDEGTFQLNRNNKYLKE
jgi:hypothetical protein